MYFSDNSNDSDDSSELDMRIRPSAAAQSIINRKSSLHDSENGLKLTNNKAKTDKHNINTDKHSNARDNTPR